MKLSRESLSFRLLIAVSIVLASFFWLAGIALERAFREGAEQAMHERLLVHIYALLGAVELNSVGRLQFPKSLPNERFSHPGSGLYGFVFSTEGRMLWHSDSAMGINVEPPLDHLAVGSTRFIQYERLSFLYYAVLWEGRSGHGHHYLFAVAEERDAVESQISSFRETLWFSLGGVGIVLVFVQLGLLHWGLRPLRAIAKDLEEMERGHKTRLDNRYPLELQGLATNLNALLESERSHLERYRNSLSDLAHSMKTPLAIVRGCIEEKTMPDGVKQPLQEQIQRMDEIMSYQLQKAAARGQKTLSSSIAIVSMLEKVIRSLDKVYSAKGVDCCLHADSHEVFCGDEGDLYEIFGNLLDNAYKWCHSRIEIELEFSAGRTKMRKDLHIVIEDDGPGIPPDQLETILGRGIRADEQIQGHGIGLAVVDELVRLWGGRIKFSNGRLPGARCELWLPSPI